ncbi:MAG: DsbA family oxidoreductase [Cyclobacteriaceae bacterium]|nr:DsbA family oxidoreductase [Cyclobacteriaceae bacterium]
MKKREIQVEIVSDVVCPWCYIGKRRFERAVDELKSEYDISVTYSPFELNAEMPKEGVDQKAYLVKKFGSEEKFRQLTNNVVNTAKLEGLSFDFDQQRISPNTRDAHRIIAFAKVAGKQAEVNEAFMKAYFEDGIDLSKNDNLIRIAVEAGLEKEEVTDLLNSDKGIDEVELAEGMNHQRGISGVPFFIINNKYGLSGAQPTETFIKVLTEIGDQVVLAGETCDPEQKDC